ncbi:bifunctional 2-C-methyl-D-erythritol 4-phosphate cytidylyltransferase/2-C-methyl-D-erythritol 2,4-cyclodiphosphate synthase [Bosea sp. 124]|uniref:bifunctional 2-C-methyl-D-erythritol 4-phosphate cytidylyltransferase/2-C-methyl-D-erythritol 2,4-cyclodiphosphate synthase n=1 Tax=Bosea sp. 124 TaxID=2135642 RepID=UPI000D4CF7E9|nr:bifunctional 2-C-methyl-D-erythritol 4-phosphate cytidylyltransferase/2-C-methyl-D-erythritol 2,4-cyclodiphosphate synthase [Bosea sp. 124]PTM43017.1 2-C-methyl-D-erythritol 2,4-cyclodiphosphate synthase [Bosea sp. 124]
MAAEPDDSTVPVAALLVAAGRGLRAGGDAPKQYRMLGGRPVLGQALAPFLALPAITRIKVVIGAGDEARYADAIASIADDRLALPTPGGATRQDSVRLGLEALAEAGFNGAVLVHDAARPFVSAALIGAAVGTIGRDCVAAIPVLPVTDTIKRIDASGCIAETPQRDRLVSVQTPQAFRFDALLAAHRAAFAAGRDGFTDDAALMEWAGHPVATFPGEPSNLKLTHPEDFARAGAPAGRALVVRVGTGYDVHAFADGDHVWLGGVRIAHARGVLAHSDGDVALHALTDALLGALADGDIGTHFPPSDPQWQGAASHRFLSFAAERVRQRGGRIDFLDLTIVCEAPKVGPHREAIRETIAAAAGLRIDQVAIKATTSERMGFTGRKEGLAALATATIRLPEIDPPA